MALPTPPTSPVPPLRARLGDHLGVAFDVVAWAPDAADVDLSVGCMFEHEAGGAGPTGGPLHLDQALGHALSDARAAGRFSARELDTLLVSRPPAGVRARAVLVVGLGDPAALSEATLERACALAVSQALRLGARTAAFAPNLRDAGIVVPPAMRTAHALVRGAWSALALAARLARLGLASPAPLRAWSFDAGAAHFMAVADDFARAFGESVPPRP